MPADKDLHESSGVEEMERVEGGKWARIQGVRKPGFLSAPEAPSCWSCPAPWAQRLGFLPTGPDGEQCPGSLALTIEPQPVGPQDGAPAPTEDMLQTPLFMVYPDPATRPAGGWEPKQAPGEPDSRKS